MSILKNLKKAHAAVVAQNTTNDLSPIGTAINRAAMAAMFGGLGSNDWNSYMATFADNEEQLQRLTVRDANEEPYITQMRAYILVNGCCDIGTNAFMNNKVDEKIDGIAGSNKNPPVPDAPNDPNGKIANLRPADLKSIPDVNV
jgi:hypothetical protein